MSNVDESLSMLAQLLLMWGLKEDEPITPMHNEIVNGMFGVKVLTKKMDVLHDIGFDIVIPDPLLMILDTCVESNPGQIQIVFRYLLDKICERRGGKIPKGYVITSMDFALAFPNTFPLMAIPEVNKKFEAMWDAQKRPREGFGSDNRVDSVEYWEEVMER